MAVTLYSYGKLCDSERLKQEIGSSAITIALDYITTSSSPVTTNVYMKDELSGGDQAVLDALASAHIANPLPDNEVASVLVVASPSYGAKTILHNNTTYKLFARNTGKKFVVQPGDNVLSYIATYPWVKVVGVEVVGCDVLDVGEMRVYDNTQGNYSGVPNLLLNQFGYTLNMPQGFYKREATFDADLYQGMCIKIDYHSVASIEKTIGVNFIMSEVKL